jgi:membrane fusion protein (multidrug efflux system)
MPMTSRSRARRHRRRFLLTLGGASLGVLMAACGGDGDAAEPGAGAPPAVAGKAPAGSAMPGPGGPTPSGGPASGRSGGSIVLSSADIHKVATGLIEEGAAISGNLRPIETVSIRARLEGDLTQLLVREGDVVHTGALLAQFESTEQEAALRSAEADEIAARTEAQTAQWNLDQTRDLFKAGAVSERDMRAAEQAAATANARLAAGESRVRAAASLSRDTRVTSPVNGVVERRNVENGERVSRGEELFTVVRSDVLELTAAVPARRANSLRRGQVVRFSADGRAIEGRVSRVSPTIDLASQSVTVYVEVPNRNLSIKGNAFATGQVIERAIPGQLLVPQSAIRQAAAGADIGTFVWKIQGGALVSAPVRLGIVDEARGVVQVLSGLAAGDEVVVGNVGMMGAGMQVQVIGTESRGAR